MPRFSVVIPYFNRPELLANCIRKLRDQPFDDWEAVVVDDASTHAATESLRGLREPRLRILRSAINHGAGRSRNIGLDAAEGEYILFLDCDDELTPKALTTFDSLLDATGAAVAVGGWSDLFRDGSQRRIRLAHPYADDIANCVAGGWVTGSFVIRRSLCPRVSESRATWEMAETVLEAVARASGAVAYTREIVVVVRQQSELSLTLAHDHFNPHTTAAFWLDMRARHGLGFERLSAFDKRIFDCALNLHWEGERGEAARLAEAVSRRNLLRYPWARALGPAWMAGWLGPRVGLRLHAGLSSLKRAVAA